jgi:hypothetical protein
MVGVAVLAASAAGFAAGHGDYGHMAAPPLVRAIFTAAWSAELPADMTAVGISPGVPRWAVAT